MTLQSLRYFVAVAEHGNFSKAAELLFVSQPTISRSIVALEEEFNVPLFTRGKYKVTMTPSGTTFYLMARKMLDYADEIQTSMTQLRALNEMSLRISYHHFDSNIAYVILESLNSLSERHPEISVFMTEYSSALDSLDINSGKCDIIFTCDFDAKAVSNVNSRLIFTDPMVGVLPVSHPLADKETLFLSDLADNSIILPCEVNSLLAHELMKKSFHNKNCFPKSMKTVPSFTHLALSIIRGEGIAITAKTLAVSKGFENTDTLRCIPIADFDLSFDVVMAWNNGNTNPAIPLFTKEVEQCLERHCN